MNKRYILSMFFALIAVSNIQVAQGGDCPKGSTSAWDDINNVAYCQRNTPVKPGRLGPADPIVCQYINGKNICNK
jgi:hypothetical protein